MARPSYLFKAFFLIFYCYGIAMLNTAWVGDVTIYSKELYEKRIKYHQAVLNNVPPGARWGDQGDNGVNIRILTVYMAEFIKKISRFSPQKIYKGLDFICIMMMLIALFVYLRKWYAPIYCIMAISYVGIILPMTYHFHVFQPWDRISCLIWVLSLIALSYNKYYLLFFLLIVGVLIKFDIILFPCIYFLSYYSTVNRRYLILKTIVLFFATFGTYYLLRILIPEGFVERNILSQILINWQGFIGNIFAYPPLIVFAIPMFLILYGWGSMDKYHKSCVIFGAMMLMVFSLQTNVIEIRAEIPVLLLFIPAALNGYIVITKDISLNDVGREIAP